MEDKKKFIINVLYYALILVLVVFAYKYLLPVLFPFIVGFVIAFISLRICRNLFKNESKVMRIVVTTILFILLFGLIVLIGVIGVNKIIDLVAAIPSQYKSVVEPALNNLEKALINLNNDLPIEIKTDVNEIIGSLSDSIKNIVNSFSTSFVSLSTSLISNTTQIIIDVTIIIVTAYFFVLDYEKIFAYLVSKMSDEVKEIYFEIKYYFQNTVLLILKSYGLIMFITFVELYIGLLIIGVDNFAVLSLAIAFLDILPILGVGTVLIPWGIFDLITGNVRVGISILVLYVIITLIRNVIEPKIVGGNIGLHPLVTLSSMLMGLEWFGALGMFGLPLMISFLVKRKKEQDIIEEGVK